MSYFKVLILLLCAHCCFANPRYRTGGSKIVGGHDTMIDEVPWQVSQLNNGSHFCGGVIIGPNLVLTAAHCYQDHAWNLPTQYRAGSSNRSSGGTLHSIESVVVHPNFTLDEGAGIIDNDIALVTVREPFIFGDSVQAINIADEEPIGGEDALISGWGLLHSGDNEPPEMLQSVVLPVVDWKECHDDYVGFIWNVTDTMICIGVPEGGVGACSGDSGGPMVVRNRLVGLASWSLFCALPKYPTVYTSVAVFKQWIQNEIRNLKIYP